MRQKLRDYIGMPDEWKKPNQNQYKAEMRTLLEASLSLISKERITFAEVLTEMDIQSLRQIEAHHKLFSKERNL